VSNPPWEGKGVVAPPSNPIDSRVETTIDYIARTLDHPGALPVGRINPEKVVGGCPSPTSRSKKKSKRRSLDRYLSWMVRNKASDLHLSPGFPPTLRIDRRFRRGKAGDLGVEDVQEMVDNLLTGRRLEEYERELAVDMGYSLEGKGRFRISCFRQQTGPALSVRHIPVDVPTLAELGLPATLMDLVEQPSGLLLFCGPTGSGKSTTQASLLKLINEHRALHVITLEDPIEYLHRSRRSLIHQREVGEHATSFSRGLRDALREDPDVILVGELRDRETISMALTAAETGHLVMGTLHVSTTATAVTRVLHAFTENERSLARAQLSESLLAVVNQRLLPHAGGKGLVPIVELLKVNHAAASLIRDDKLHQLKQVLTTCASEGMSTFERSAARACVENRVRQSDARRMVPERQVFDQLLERMEADAGLATEFEMSIA